MLDVHPPHEPVHGWRDLAIHLATITAGLLIALGLEAVVEAAHHHELAAQARENIEHELERNVEHAKVDIVNVQATISAIDTVLTTARQRRDDPHPGAGAAAQVNVTASWDSFENAAWLTARESGALAHMPLDEVQKYAGLYARQEQLNNEAAVVMGDAPLVMAPLFVEDAPGKASPDDVRLIMLRSADTKVKLMIFKQLVEGLGGAYADARGVPAPTGPASAVTAPASTATAASVSDKH